MYFLYAVLSKKVKMVNAPQRYEGNILQSYESINEKKTCIIFFHKSVLVKDIYLGAGRPSFQHQTLNGEVLNWNPIGTGFFPSARNLSPLFCLT